MTTPMTPERRAEIRARVDATPRGPWHVEYFGDAGYPQRIANDAAIIVADTHEGGPEGLRPIPEFIAHSRVDVPDLLADVDRLTARLAAAEALPGKCNLERARELHRALGLPLDLVNENQGRPTWGDWWRDLLATVEQDGPRIRKARDRAEQAEAEVERLRGVLAFVRAELAPEGRIGRTLLYGTPANASVARDLCLDAIDGRETLLAPPPEAGPASEARPPAGVPAPLLAAALAARHVARDVEQRTPSSAMQAALAAAIPHVVAEERTEIERLNAQPAADQPWNEAVDWLLNSHYTGDPDCQSAFWAMADGYCTREHADRGYIGGQPIVAVRTAVEDLDDEDLPYEPGDRITGMWPADDSGTLVEGEVLRLGPGGCWIDLPDEGEALVFHTSITRHDRRPQPALHAPEDGR